MSEPTLFDHLEETPVKSKRPRKPPQPVQDAPAANACDEPLRELLLNHIEGAAHRWKQLKKAGADDAALRKAVAFEFGIKGGRCGPGMADVSYSGGGEPKFWLGTMTHDGKPTLKGKALVDAVRRVMGIPMTTNGTTRQPDALDAVKERITAEQPWRATLVKGLVGLPKTTLTVLEDLELTTLGQLDDVLRGSDPESCGTCKVLGPRRVKKLMELMAAVGGDS